MADRNLSLAITSWFVSLGNVADSGLDLVGVINGKYQGETRLHKHAQSCKITTLEVIK